ncbi:MucR family transcriptional regulator [Rickettsiales bacterium]|nr:MucR family transcriptional regulator [Rickettsiales bacterium]
MFDKTPRDMEKSEQAMTLSSKIVSGWASCNNCTMEELQKCIILTFSTLSKQLNSKLSFNAGSSELGKFSTPESTFTDDYIVCLEDGKKLKMLKRHLRSKYNMTIAEYRNKWQLPIDYPTVAKNYAQKRSQIAKKIKSKGLHSQAIDSSEANYDVKLKSAS